MITIEVCVDSLESARVALEGGANRLEICANLGLGGGTTPSIGLVRAIKVFTDVEYFDEHKIDLFAMVRPRTGDFVYTQEELAVMALDIEEFGRMRLSGVVFGCLTPDGDIDVDAMENLLGRADYYDIRVCFHRAFDMVQDQKKALETITSDSLSYVSRILTSGGGPTASASLQSLKELFTTVKQFNESHTPKPKDTESDSDSESNHDFIPLIITPGSGINEKTIEPILRELLPLGLSEIHLSGGSWVEGPMLYRPEGMNMGVDVTSGTVGTSSEWGVWKTDVDKVQAVRRIVDRVWNEYTAIDVKDVNMQIE